MPDSFNPYREWLGLDVGPASPNYYRLLGLGREATSDEVKRAADYAINRVRSIRPGERIAEWSRVIDELRTAQSVLTDPERRAAYDAKLQARKANGSSGRGAKRKQEDGKRATPGGSEAASPSANTSPPATPLSPDPFAPVAVSPVIASSAGATAASSAARQPSTTLPAASPASGHSGWGSPPSQPATIQPLSAQPLSAQPISTGPSASPGASSYSANYADPMAPVATPGGYGEPAPQGYAQVPLAVPTGYPAPAGTAAGGAIPYARPVGAPTGAPTAVAPAPAPAYGLAPSYEAAPSYDAPAYGTPSYGTPSYGAPAYGAPTNGATGYGAAPGYAPAPAYPNATGPIVAVAPAGPLAPVQAVAAPGAAPLSGAAAQEASIAPVSKGRVPRRRRRSALQNFMIGLLGMALVGILVGALYVGLNQGDDPSGAGNSVAKVDSPRRPGPSNPASTWNSGNRPNRGNGPARTGGSFVPPSKTDLPPLSAPPADMANSPAPRVPGAPPAADPAMTDQPAPTSPSSAPSAPPQPEPPPARTPSETEKAQTAQAIRAALAALRQQDFDAADAQLAQVESLPKTPEDESRFTGARQLAQSARAFVRMVQQGFAQLKPEQEISFNSTSVKVKEVTPENVSIEVVPGVIKKYTADTLPLGLRYGVLNVVLPPENPANPLAKAAYHAMHPEGDPAEAEHFLGLAQAAGADVSAVRQVLESAGAASPTSVAVMPEPPAPATPPAPAASAATPAPMPQPAPEPTPPPMPTPAERKELTRLAQTARLALGERNLDEADAMIAQALELARLPEHQQKLEALKQLAYYTREFWRAVDESLKGLSAVGELAINDTIISIVEARPNHLVIKVAGQVRRYSRNDMPGGLAMAVANHWLNQDEPATRAVKGALYAVEKKGDPGKARELWQEAAQMGLDTSLLLSTLDETYDFTQTP